MRTPIVLTLDGPKARHGVPAHLAARYVARVVPAKKGRGAYVRKPRHANKES
jgi:hypothetical protein